MWNATFKLGLTSVCGRVIFSWNLKDVVLGDVNPQWGVLATAMNVKKMIDLLSKTTRLHVHHAFFKFHYRYCMTTTYKCLISFFYGGQKQATPKFFINGVFPAVAVVNAKSLLNEPYVFLSISLPSLHDYYVKLPNFAFCGRRKYQTTTFYFFSSY